MADVSKDDEVLELPLSRYANHPTVLSEDKAPTAAFLDANPLLLPVLIQTVEQVSKYFDDTPLMLELVTDPDDGKQELLLTIDSPLKAEDTLQRFEQFRDDCWLDTLEKTDSKLSIALNYPIDDV